MRHEALEDRAEAGAATHWVRTIVGNLPLLAIGILQISLLSGVSKSEVGPAQGAGLYWMLGGLGLIIILVGIAIIREIWKATLVRILDGDDMLEEEALRDFAAARAALERSAGSTSGHSTARGD